MPNLYVISGCNGSGKTTASYTLLPNLFKCRQFVNSDEFAKGLSPFSPDKAKVQASRYMLLKIRYLITRKEDFAIETTLSTRSLQNLLSNAREFGYKITIIYFWIKSPELAIERVRARVAAGGHNIPEDVIRRRYYSGLEYFFKIYKNIADKWILADNTKIPFTIIAQGWQENMVVKDNMKFEKVKNQALTLQKNQEYDD